MAIPTSRSSAAFQTHMDWAALRDDKALNFGNDFDASITWSTSNSALEIVGATTITGTFAPTGAVTFAGDVNMAGGDIALSDTVKLEIGDAKTVYLIASADASTASDSLIIAGLPSSDTGASGALFTSDTDTLLHITA